LILPLYACSFIQILIKLTKVIRASFKLTRRLFFNSPVKFFDNSWVKIRDSLDAFLEPTIAADFSNKIFLLPLIYMIIGASFARLILRLLG